MFMNEKELTKNWTIQKTSDSPILIAKKEIIVPERKIVLLDEINEEEMAFVKKLGYKGGIIV